MKGLSLVLVVVLLGGCATQTQTGTAVGAGVGAGLGAIIGGVVGGGKGAAIGAALGAAVGAGTGALVGNYLDRQVASRAATARQVDYSANQGTRVEIQRSELAPVSAPPGATVVSRVEYSVLAPNPSTTVPLNEVRYVQRDGQTVMGPEQRQVTKPQGTHVSQYEFKVPDGTPPGHYTMLTVLETGQGPAVQRKTAESTLNIAAR